MDQVYKQLAVSQDGDSILNDLYGHDISITESGDITAQDIVCANITVSGVINGTINGVINQSSVSAEEITLTGTNTNTPNGVLFKKADGKLYTDGGLKYLMSQAILNASNIETQSLKVNTSAVVAFEEEEASFYAHDQSAYRAISQNILTGNTIIDSGGTTSLLSQGINGVRVNAENNTTEYKNDTHKFTNILGESQMFIKSNGSVGLGVEQPVSKLHLSDVGGCSIRLDSVAPITGGSRIIFAEETLTKYQIANTANNDFLIAEGNDYIFYHDVSLSKTNLSGLLYIDAAAQRVGVGTSSPGADLDVSASGTQPALRIVQTGLGDCLQIHDVATDSTRFSIDADGDMVVKGGSKLGSSCLTMHGLENTSGVNSITFDTVHHPELTPGTPSGWDYWSKSMIMGGYVNRNTGEITLANSNGSAALGAIFSSYFICDGGDTHIGSCNTAYTGNVSGGLSTVAADYTRIFIDGLNGNVGISENSPTAKLQVSSNSSEPAVKIQQSGTGDCIQIHDQATDTTYLCVNANGQLGVGNGAPTRDLDVRTTVDDGVANNVIVARTKTGARLFEVSKDSINSVFVDFYDGTQAVAARIRGNGVSYFNGGPVSLGTQVVDASAKLQINSTNSGLLPPRMTTAQRNAISSPATGLIVFDTDIDSLYIKQTNNWSPLSSGAGQGGQGGSSDFMILRKTVNDTSQSTIAWDTHTKFSPNGLFNYTNGNTTFTVNQQGNYKIEFCGSFYDGNTTGEKEVYFIFEDSTGLISNSIGFIARADSATTYTNISFLDVVSLSTGVSYNFSFTSNTGQTASMYANGRCLITYLS